MKKLLTLITAVIFIGMAYVVAQAAETANQEEVLIVQNSQGEYVGTITDALIDSSGNIGFVIVSIGDKMGEGQKEIAVPTASFSPGSQGKLLLDVPKETLATAPEFNVSDLGDPKFGETVYRFFGLLPPWTEETSGTEM